jgi:hypothetical protein
MAWSSKHINSLDSWSNWLLSKHKLEPKSTGDLFRPAKIKDRDLTKCLKVVSVGKRLPMSIVIERYSEYEKSIC